MADTTLEGLNSMLEFEPRADLGSRLLTRFYDFYSTRRPRALARNLRRSVFLAAPLLLVLAAVLVVLVWTGVQGLEARRDLLQALSAASAAATVAGALAAYWMWLGSEMTSRGGIPLDLRFEDARKRLDSPVLVERIEGLSQLCRIGDSVSEAQEMARFEVLRFSRRAVSPAGAAVGPVSDDVQTALLLLGWTPLNQRGEFEVFDTSGLASLVLEGVKLFEVDYRGFDFSDTTFRGAMVLRSQLSDVRFEGSRWESVVLMLSDLPRARGSGAEFRNTEFFSVNLTRANLGGSRWERCGFAPLGEDQGESLLERVDFGRAVLHDVVFYCLEIDEVVFSGAELLRVVFVGCRLRGCRFRHAKFQEVSFVDTALEDCSMAEARFERLSFRGRCPVSKSDFGNTEGLRWSMLLGANIDRWTEATLPLAGRSWERALDVRTARVEVVRDRRRRSQERIDPIDSRAALGTSVFDRFASLGTSDSLQKPRVDYDSLHAPWPRLRKDPPKGGSVGDQLFDWLSPYVCTPSEIDRRRRSKDRR